jgi:hypothetical protein
MAVGYLALFVHLALIAPPNKIEEPVSFYSAIAVIFMFIMATIVSLIVFLRGCRRTT